MEIIIQATPEAATEIAARLIARRLKEKPDAVLGLATGSTPLLLYRALIAMKLDIPKAIVRPFLPKNRRQTDFVFSDTSSERSRIWPSASSAPGFSIPIEPWRSNFIVVFQR